MAVIRQRKTSKGIKKYQAYIRIKGYKPVLKTFSKYSAAVEWAKKIEVQMKDGTYKEISKELEQKLQTNFNNMESLISFYKTNIAPQKYSYAEKYNVMFDWWTNQIGLIKIRDLTASMITACKQILINEKIKKKDKEVTRGNSTINKYLMCLSAILTYAVKDLELIETNPVSKVSLMPKPKGRTRFLTMEEIKSLSEACKNHSDFLYIFFLIAISTGGRYTEILNLKIENIDFKNNQVHYLNTKNNENRGVPIYKNILDLIKQYMIKNDIKEGYLFTNKKNKRLYIRGYLQNVIKKIELKDFHIHDIRHTTASYIAMNGGSLLDIAEILGHKSLIMARRYSHLTDKHTATVLNKVINNILPNI